MGELVSGIREAVRGVMWRWVGLVRDAQGLAAAREELERLEERWAVAAVEAGEGGRFETLVDLYETRNLLTAGRLVTAAAEARRESRGAHFREDFPAEDPGQRHRLRAWIDANGRVRVGDPLRVGDPAAEPAEPVAGSATRRRAGGGSRLAVGPVVASAAPAGATATGRASMGGAPNGRPR